MLGTDILTFQEFMTHEPLPLATVQAAVFECLQGRDDVVVFGAQAVNAYVGEPRMTQDIEVLALQAAAFAEELRTELSQRFFIFAVLSLVLNPRSAQQIQQGKQDNPNYIDKVPVNLSRFDAKVFLH